MGDDFNYDVFLTYSPKDKAAVRDIAEYLRAEGLRIWFDDWELHSSDNIWFDDWELHSSDNIQAKIEEGLERSRVLVLCVSKNAFGTDWAQLEAHTFRFRDPLNKGRRFIPLRLDKVELLDSLKQFYYIDWNSDDQHKLLLTACRQRQDITAESTSVILPLKLLKVGQAVPWVGISEDGRRGISGGSDGVLRLWNVETGKLTSRLSGHTEAILGVRMTPDAQRAVSSSKDATIKIWDLITGRCIQTIAHTALRVALSANGKLVVSGGSKTDSDVWVWDTESGQCLGTLAGHFGRVTCTAITPDAKRAVSGSEDNTVMVWDLVSMSPLFTLRGHTSKVMDVAVTADGKRAVSASHDTTVRIWNLETGQLTIILEGHTSVVRGVDITPDGFRVISGANDNTVRIWDLERGNLLTASGKSPREIVGVSLSADGCRAISGSYGSYLTLWELPAKSTSLPRVSDQSFYTNAKVLLVGESGAGKTGLSKRLALNDWQPSDSTVGAWATQWKLPVLPGGDGTTGIDREIWLWDFGGQADQRLIHQLYMDETAVAVLVFDGQREDLFETLGQWDRDLTRASRQAFSKLLVAGRIDASGLRVSRTQIEAFKNERGYLQFLETSAKSNFGCEELKQAIFAAIRWENIPWRSSPLLFRRLKEGLIQLKDEGRVLIRFNELRETLQLRLSSEFTRFTDEELKAVVRLLSGPGIVWELKFGSWVLLQPERINAYAQAVIQTLREDEHERGCLPEERVLKGDLTYHSSIQRLGGEDERFILLAMHQILVERGLCLREQTEKGPLLIFPSYYRRERPELIGHPAVLVSYRFSGFLDDIYATLVVRLHHTAPFQQDQLWRYAADFRTLTGKQLGFKLTRRAEGAGELEVYFDPTISMEEKIIFSKYVHEHLLQNGQDVVRLRHYVCPHCGTPVGNREVAMRKLEEGKKDIFCVNCDDPGKRIPLWDQMEELFASQDVKLRVRQLQEQSEIVLDNESKERALVGEVISTVALAGQLSREFSVSDHGIDMEIEFKSDTGEATGRKLYLQLKSGDSYLRQRKGDGAEIFKIKDERHARYWMEQAFPVLLVIRNSEGEIRWMEIQDFLKRASDNGKRSVTQIVFVGERFDVMSVRHWRSRVLR
jgi:small GTP-binding protein